MHRVTFSPAYAAQIRDGRWATGAGVYVREMLRLIDAPDGYAWLGAAQQIQRAFGFALTLGDRPATLLCLYWEPTNPDASLLFEAHRREIAAFADRVAGSAPSFMAMGYPDLWEYWCEGPQGPK